MEEEHEEDEEDDDDEEDQPDVMVEHLFGLVKDLRMKVHPPSLFLFIFSPSPWTDFSS